MKMQMPTAKERAKHIKAGYRYYVVGNGALISKHKTYSAANKAARRSSFYGVREIQL